ncbi:MAG: single-stranded DNA-binding protein [Zetaproteobacteria bacterium]|nr:single-stranded DNA-binding protein [Zetaproteobacteria bacterium]
MLNKAILIGNLGQDPETRFMQDGTCVCNLRLATTEKFKGRDGQTQEKTEWHRVVIWGKLGEIANQYLKKGARVYIEGKIETRKWTNKEGQDQYTTEIRASEMKMLGGGQQGGGGGNQQGGGYNQQPQQGGYNNPSNNNNYNAPSSNSNPFEGNSDFSNGPVDDDIPF